MKKFEHGYIENKRVFFVAHKNTASCWVRFQDGLTRLVKYTSINNIKKEGSQ